MDRGGGSSAKPSVSKHAAVFVTITVIIDAMGIGIIIPVTPDLIRELADASISEAALWGGYLAFIYALMQFAFGPTLGNLSDRFGRRRVLLVSLAALAVDYVIMGLAPTLWLLFVGRLIAGIAGATHSTANAYMADISPPEKRAQNFGLLGAGFGIGFVLGPVIGGFLGEFGTRAPFFAAAAFAFVNLIYGYFVLPESLTHENRRSFSWYRANPLGTAKQIAKFPALAWLMFALFLYNIAHHVYPAIWSFFAKEAYSWSNFEIGVSLTIVGVGFAVVQGWLIRVLLKRHSEQAITVFGFLVGILSLVIIAFLTKDWMVYPLIPIMALGAVITPALTGLMSQQVPADGQGELQGAIASVTGITLIVSPILLTQVFGHFTGHEAPVYFPGAPFLTAALIMVLAMIPLFIGFKKLK